MKNIIPVQLHFRSTSAKSSNRSVVISESLPSPGNAFQASIALHLKPFFGDETAGAKQCRDGFTNMLGWCRPQASREFPRARSTYVSV